MTDLTRVTADDVVAEVRRRVRVRRRSLIDSGLDDRGTRDLIRALGNVRVGVYSDREVRATNLRCGLTSEAVLTPALDVDLVALGMPRQIADTADVYQVEEGVWGLRWKAKR